MAGSARPRITPTSAAPFAPTIRARSMFPRGSARDRALSARRLRTLPETAIYRTPEQGIAAWYFLLFDRYGFGKTGQFDLASLARKYAGQNASPAEVKAYTGGWSKWSNGALQLDTVIH